MARDRSLFRRALEVSILLHLLLVFVLAPRAREIWPSALSAAPLFRVPEEDEEPPQPPLEFEFVDLAEEREERPSSERAPLSDLDRRAHGGVGEEPSQSPGSQGNTYQLVQADGGELLGRQSPQRRPVPPAPPAPVPRPAPDGAGEARPEPETQPPTVPLPAADAWTLPPEEGGLAENPDREGGRVDEGGLSFDTQWYDWGPYARRMLAKIRRNWRIPEIARLGIAGTVRIRFYLERDGSVSGLQLEDESGKPPMDFAARDAIGNSSPFDPLPTDLTGVEREGVTITFYYNSRPPDRGGR